MPKTLKVKLQQNCIGCEMCVFEAQRQLQKVGFEGSLIRIRKSPDGTEFSVEIDPKISRLDIEKILKICPANVFEISEGESSNEFGE